MSNTHFKNVKKKLVPKLPLKPSLDLSVVIEKTYEDTMHTNKYGSEMRSRHVISNASPKFVNSSGDSKATLKEPKKPQ